MDLFFSWGMKPVQERQPTVPRPLMTSAVLTQVSA